MGNYFQLQHSAETCQKYCPRVSTMFEAGIGQGILSNSSV